MTFFFHDYSQYNPVVTNDPYPVRIARSSIGLVKDTEYDANKAAAATEGERFVAYHFLDAHQLADPSAQADFAFQVVGSSVPLMIDHEPNRGYLATLADMWTFVNRYRQLGGIVHLNYLPHHTWDLLGQPSLVPLVNAGIAITNADYTAYSDTGPGWAQYGGVTPVQWQFTDSPYDTNAFRGTVDEYWGIIAPELVHAVTELTEEDDMYFQLNGPNDFAAFTPPSVSSGRACYVCLATDHSGDAVVQPAFWYDGGWHQTAAVTVTQAGGEVTLPIIDKTNVRKVSLFVVSGGRVGVSVVPSVQATA